MPKSTYFKNSWLSKFFSEWLVKNYNDKNNFKCKWCSCTLTLSNMGRKAFTIHMNGTGLKLTWQELTKYNHISIMLDQVPMGWVVREASCESGVVSPSKVS